MTTPSRSIKVQQANAKMIAAWQEGHDLLDRLGPRAAPGAMMQASGQDLSEAERLRKLRAVASRMTQKEVREICRRCEKYERAWGPQYLVTLSRLPKAAERRKLVTQALQDGWGLKELQRRIRLELAQNGTPARRNRLGAGRRRKIDWANPNEVADEVERMATSWLHFRDELQAAATEQEMDNHLDLLPEHLRHHFPQVNRVVEKMLKASE